ncbi:hypothetical protein SULI_02925 [Saccharolobus solfataricus]|uniref:Uncharacterized protein n=3 Tax=Saccharolobus solfataricus TaxID=2287 RepID=Q97V67_SACS2|nr:hypothetical protein [Saccharolobus solfataricus]AAK42878.1 Conserved hypothetical protein [Saccharolobus solfataricus P2]AKA72970.1 hypothetical protein SULB_0573 [Saccharolobus solfataricus]AKA75669.1 hypothetical protein SULC_0571 [Saccharolobus solfataricus]AKA78362.1 hypothetical protein SULA_0571 [Saccharolobus solfataricus]AZF67481.1 hypothetical protein SULG_02925 [Saccharolobus solfataricus]
MIFKYSNGTISSEGLTLCTVKVERNQIRVEGNYNFLLKREGLDSYEIYQYNSKIGEIKNFNLQYSIFNFVVSRPQLVAFKRGYENIVKIFTNSNTEVGEIKRVQDGLEGYLNDAYDPYIILIYLVVLSNFINVISYPKYRTSRVSKYRGLFYFIPLLLILVYLIPLPFYIDLAIYVALLIIFYYLLVIRRILILSPRAAHA